ncbi:uncharacterized protein STEHIDRAFT_53363 [Stereum hirsutum FP-91666 SS1]|uniref:uncharacterized protein n=1 Tax=Stereum hirsutum (strain FP-91666) TaxID=721885 RepID=UPI000440C9DD|nr:uncharacterized protein STEHIDRAFT_53363 [Stereum hirsutum FP-91666 SS1]EIM88928.1 hypothetical protein STEHIDRAFT_53363 [Stereum hirsutum FP-91666 SS1]
MVAHPIQQLLQTVFFSILEVFLVCLAGWILARRGILDKKTQRSLNVLNVSLFTPCLLFSKVAFFLSPAKLKELWIIPLFFAAVSLASMGVAWSLGWVFGLKRTQRNFAMAAAMFMNSNSLPIALLQSLVVTVPGLQWGDDDSVDAMVGRALTYLVMCSTLGMVVRWSYGVRLLSDADPDAVPDPLEETLNQQHEPLIPSIAVQTPSGTLHHGGLAPGSSSKSPQSDNTIFRSFPNTPYRSQNGTPDETPDETEVETDLSDGELPQHMPRSSAPFPNIGHGRPRLPSSRSPSPIRTPSTVRALRKRTTSGIKKVWHAINGFMTAPLWAAILSLVVALIQPLQHALDVHLWPVKAAVSQAGACSIPLTLIVLGAYFYKAPPPEEEGRKRKNGRKVRSESRWRRERRGRRERRERRETEKMEQKGETKTVIIAIVARMVIVPALFLPVMVLGAWLDLPTVFEDPVFVLALVLLASSPPALTLAQITQAASGDAFERLLSRTIFWSYCVVTPPATIVYSVLAMVIAKL